MSLSTLGTKKLDEVRNTWHSELWTLKFIMLIISFLIPFFIPPEYIRIYGMSINYSSQFLVQLVFPSQLVKFWAFFSVLPLLFMNLSFHILAWLMLHTNPTRLLQVKLLELVQGNLQILGNFFYEKDAIPTCHQFYTTSLCWIYLGKKKKNIYIYSRTAFPESFTKKIQKL